jgi:flagellar motor switch protein FliM
LAGNRRRDSPTGEEKDNIIKGIENSILEVKAEFEKSSIKLEDLYSMNVGDVLNLNMPKTSEINVNIGSKPWFKGKLGIYRENVAVRLTGIYKTQQTKNAGGEDNERRL